MIHIFCENCDGFVALPAGTDHRCGRDVISGGHGIFVGGDDWFSDDSDYGYSDY